MAIDTHAHLEMEAFDKDREAVLERATAAGLTAIVTVGTTLPDCEKAVALARRYAPVYAAVGIHPHEVKEIDAAAYDALRLFAREKKVVAIGEIGLDFFYDNSPRNVQLRCFTEQLDLAEELDLPIIVHDRDAHAETLGLLRQRKGRLRGVLHCFSGTAAMARECVTLGFHLAGGRSETPWWPSPTRSTSSSARATSATSSPATRRPRPATSSAGSPTSPRRPCSARR